MRITLSGTTYVLRFRYNYRSTRWMMDIADASNNDILDGMVMKINTDLTYQFRTSLSNLPPGQFFVIDNTGNNNQPTQYSFGNTHTLYYADPDS
jgi:hypothetical protein